MNLMEENGLDTVHLRTPQTTGYGLGILSLTIQSFVSSI